MLTASVRGTQVNIEWLIHSLGVDTNHYNSLSTLFASPNDATVGRGLCALRKTSPSDFFYDYQADW